jgi:hypothetical protein
VISAILSLLSSLFGLGNKAAAAAQQAADMKAGAAAQQATDQGAIIDAAQQRAAADSADNALSDDQLRQSLRTPKQ